jgi:hypothetical protein
MSLSVGSELSAYGVFNLVVDVADHALDDLLVLFMGDDPFAHEEDFQGRRSGP